MNLKELREAFYSNAPVKYGKHKCLINEISNHLHYTTDPCNQFEICLTSSTYHGTIRIVFKVEKGVESVTPWEEPTTKGENMKTQEEKTLELIKAALAGETILWIDGEVTSFKGLDLISLIMENPSSYSIKPKTETVNYQTRLYLTTGGAIYVWNSLNNTYQDRMEGLSSFVRWLEPVQKHVCEYEVK